MKENEMSVLEQYHIDVNSTRKVRGAILCDTNQGLFLLKEIPFSEKRIPMLSNLYNHLKEHDYRNVDAIIPTAENGIFSVAQDGRKYILKQWFHGKECDIKRESDIVEASRNLANLHKILREPIDWGKGTEPVVLTAEDLREEYARHNRELKKVRAHIRSKVGKREFELTFLKYFDYVYEWAKCSEERLEQSCYHTLFAKSTEERRVTHGEYNYHNVLVLPKGIATTNFEHFHVNIQLADFYYFLRKTMEKNHWDIELGAKMIEAYNHVLPMEGAEFTYLAICIAYPEKFWKAADSYYRSRKAWIPEKSLEKLELAIQQTEEKKQFLETIFSFHLW